jgi:hypothetical protein
MNHWLKKPADSMEEIIARANCYIKGEESNAEKRLRDANERTSNSTDRRSYQPSTGRDRVPYRKTNYRPYSRPEEFTPLNTKPERILKEVYEAKLIPDPPAPRYETMGKDKNKWCKYHRIRGHDTDSCVHLRQEIEKLIQSGKLR